MCVGDIDQNTHNFKGLELGLVTLGLPSPHPCISHGFSVMVKIWDSQPQHPSGLTTSPSELQHRLSLWSACSWASPSAPLPERTSTCSSPPPPALLPVKQINSITGGDKYVLKLAAANDLLGKNMDKNGQMKSIQTAGDAQMPDFSFKGIKKGHNHLWVRDSFIWIATFFLS